MIAVTGRRPTSLQGALRKLLVKPVERSPEHDEFPEISDQS